MRKHMLGRSVLLLLLIIPYVYYTSTSIVYTDIHNFI